MGNDILLEEKKDCIGTLILNRPDKKNALSQELLIKLHLTLEKWSADETIRTVVITGAGDQAFSSGYDVLSIPTELTQEMAELMKDHIPLELALGSVRNYPYPTIAMLNGYAFGAGFNLALCCDIRIGADHIQMGMPPAKLGLIYHPDGLRQFVEVLGFAKTREIFFTARAYKGTELKEMGLVDYLVPRSDLLYVTYDMAEKIPAIPRYSLKGPKRT
ncbi:MAG: enoyl-CoA hydratase/isomerase family protein, partial [Desulfosarcina sp.]|nr:enoyl-CoA hydratase/isomerase family protein [Desulfobacterales bacterium]